MMLVEFKDANRGKILINPDQVQLIYKDNNERTVIVMNDMAAVVDGSIDTVSFRLNGGISYDA